MIPILCVVTIVGLMACGGVATAPVPTTAPTAPEPSEPTPYPTSTPYPTYTRYPTSTPYPASGPPPIKTITPVSSTPAGVRLVVRAIHEGPPNYDRREWRQWIDADRDCQNTLAEVLIEESTEAMVLGDPCRGKGNSPGTGGCSHR